MTPRLLLPMVCLAVHSAGCDASFGVARHDLGPFRLAAMGTGRDADGARVARAAVWSGVGLFHDEAPRLAWALDGEAIGDGFDVVVPGEGTLSLVATAPDGTEVTGSVTVADEPAALAVSRAGAALGEDLTLAARRAVAGREVDGSVAADEAARLSLSFDSGEADGFSARWMSAEGAGTVLELEARAADVLALEIVWDDGEVVEREATGSGLYHQLALAIDGAGNNHWLWVDAAIGVEGPLVRHAGRLLPLAQEDGEAVAVAAVETGLLAVTLEADDGVAGVRLTDAVAADDLSAAEPLACAASGEPFELAWLAEGRCLRPDVLGVRVVLEVW